MDYELLVLGKQGQRERMQGERADDVGLYNFFWSTTSDCLFVGG
jgi:hypothetical protein